MSDREFGGNDELSLPKATVQKIINEILANDPGVTFAKETRDLLIECCVEFITMISSEANDIAEKEAKKTIACEHVKAALEDFGFSNYVDDIMQVAADQRKQQMNREKKQSKIEQSGLSEEELIRQQQELFSDLFKKTKQLPRIRFTAKQLNRQAAKAGKDEQTEKTKLEKAMKQGHNDIAKIYAQNAIRKQNEKLNLLRLASRIDAVSSRVQTAVTMRQVTGSMANVVKGMDSAMKTMDLERISAVMDKFETQFEDLDVATGYYENATSSATAVGTPQEDVDRLMAQAADKAGVELNQELEGATPAKTKIGPTEEMEDGLNERLRALRN
ncbi:Transcription factor CBF/NF-Y/archaeal histone [Macrophomina phaseolina MS6]|uniref:NCT transcriptional regulatory complex subunit B n=1 Tax=Macrophomina phaseolina (strain MS6) TaxID=1126212 RepID=K2STT3_MACPH|nr:Transcription factor CBF/NF-Y/archaeal histone [Macrophomina phaseolina MS6]